MGTITVSLPTDGDTIDVADYNTPITTVVNAINGGIDSNNISSITVPKITNPYKFRVTRTSDQTGVADETYTQIAFNSETYDTNNNFNTGTYKYTVPVTGYYLLNINARAVASSVVGTGIQIKGGAAGTTVISKQIAGQASAGEQAVSFSDLLLLTVGDLISAELYCNFTGGTATIVGTAVDLSFSGHLLSI